MEPGCRLSFDCSFSRNGLVHKLKAVTFPKAKVGTRDFTESDFNVFRCLNRAFPHINQVDFGPLSDQSFESVIDRCCRLDILLVRKPVFDRTEPNVLAGYEVAEMATASAVPPR